MASSWEVRGLGRENRMRSRRPPAVTIGAVLLAVFSVLNVLFPLFPLAGIPAAAVYIGVVGGIAGLVGAAGLWLLRKWGFWITSIVCVLNVLDAAPGITFAPTAALQFAATVTVLGFVLVIVLVGLPTSRRAFTSSS
jgi:hypothetical protein